MDRVTQMWGSRVVGMVAAAFVALGVSACGGGPVEPEALVVPNVVGMAGDEAREAIEEAGLKAELDGGDKAVIVASNWTVEAQNPAAGTSVEPEAVVTLRMAKEAAEDPSTAPSSTEASSSDEAPEPTATPWADAPTDGTWDYGDGTFGEWFTPPWNHAEYQYRFTAPPTLVTDDGGVTVRMSSILEVRRINDLGYAEPLSDDLSVFFSPGFFDLTRHDEVYGETTPVCANDQLKVEDETTCELSFTAPADEILNSYWGIDRFRIGTWPSQKAD